MDVRKSSKFTAAVGIQELWKEEILKGGVEAYKTELTVYDLQPKMTLFVRLLLACLVLVICHVQENIGCDCDDKQLRKELVASEDESWYVPFNGYKYKFTSGGKTWTWARQECERMGADLASVGIRDRSIRHRIIKALGIKNVWIGLHDIDREGKFVWVDNVRGTSNNIGWDSSEPNSAAGNEDCVTLRQNGRTADYPCHDHHVAVCEKKI
ncbi:unnamed protein product [Clavelina lepadiformis]|uniref:C-type lectin domain-containing protein n=2 Tax=Clavelina lepadiformis TaxID=159417 RepID=A0ABP0GID4_CLALP